MSVLLSFEYFGEACETRLVPLYILLMISNIHMLDLVHSGPSH
jgi:hypothetical protein